MRLVKHSKWSDLLRRLSGVSFGGSKQKQEGMKMNKQILDKWLNGWSVSNIALKHGITVDEAMAVLRDEWRVL